MFVLRKLCSIIIKLIWPKTITNSAWIRGSIFWRSVFIWDAAFCFVLGFFFARLFSFFFFFHPLKGRNISLIHFFFDRVWALDLKCLSNLNLAPLMLVTIFLSANQLTFAKRSVILIDVPLVLTAFFYFIFLLFLSF